MSAQGSAADRVRIPGGGLLAFGLFCAALAVFELLDSLLSLRIEARLFEPLFSRGQRPPLLDFFLSDERRIRSMVRMLEHCSGPLFERGSGRACQGQDQRVECAAIAGGAHE